MIKNVLAPGDEGRKNNMDLDDLRRKNIGENIQNKLESMFIKINLQKSITDHNEELMKYHRPRLDTISNMNIAFEKQKNKKLRDLDKNLVNPFDEKLKFNSKSKRKSRSPLNAILKTNVKHDKFIKVQNDTLTRILERYSLDKPIMIHDKLDIIWDKDKKNDQQQGEDTKNQLMVRAEIEKKKAQRYYGNKRQR